MAEAKHTAGEAELADHFGYLDMLRESGVTNMYGAGAYLERDQGLGRNRAREVLEMWMATFSNAPTADRARAALLKATS